MNPRPISDTLHLEVKTLEEDHIKDLWTEISAHKSELRPWLDWVDMIDTFEDYQQYMNRVQYEESIGIQKPLVVCADHQAIGEVVFDDFDAQTRSCNLGYWISPPYQKKGLMTAACTQAIDRAFESMNIDKINIRFIRSNTASLKLSQKLGFKLDGILRKNIRYHGVIEDEVIMSCFADEWHLVNRN